MEGFEEDSDRLIAIAAKELSGHKRRLFIAEVTLTLCKGNARRSEERFGWGRATAEKGMRERASGIRCLENFAARRRPRWEEKHPQLAADIQAIVEPATQTDPELKSSRRYTNLSAREVRQALLAKGYRAEEVPAERTLRDILNRMNYRLKRLQKGQPLKKVPATDAIFANVAAVKAAVRGDPETLEISMDTKAKVALGDYSRGGKNPDGFGRESNARVGPRSAGAAEADTAGHSGAGDGSLDADLWLAGDERFLGGCVATVVAAGA
jgi:Rhodopirellula transposase DDE domain